MKPILECKGLSKKYNNMYYALTNLNLALAPGQIVGLLGPNGSGKSTLIKLINDLLVPTEGMVLVDGMTPGVETKKIVSRLLWPPRPAPGSAQGIEPSTGTDNMHRYRHRVKGRNRTRQPRRCSFWSG